jgi:hypothetical protein
MPVGGNFRTNLLVPGLLAAPMITLIGEPKPAVRPCLNQPYLVYRHNNLE